MTEQIKRYATYKTYGGFKYHLNFPDEWILNELENTGRQCWNCVGHDNRTGFAMWRSILLGYCSNCAITYEFQRGRGFYGFGFEYTKHKCASAFDLYLGDVDFANYGNIEDNPEDTMENRAEFLEDLIVDYVNEDEHDELEPSDDDLHCPWNYDDQFGVCMCIGCGKKTSKMSGFCRRHAEMYD